ncbi:serine protease [Patescibacteria group bacterium]|nr:serine protease [Patescibacteria group bacterium]MBU4115804.1 serine protease [Patescibacteria group bacterium]
MFNEKTENIIKTYLGILILFLLMAAVFDIAQKKGAYIKEELPLKETLQDKIETTKNGAENKIDETDETKKEETPTSSKKQMELPSISTVFTPPPQIEKIIQPPMPAVSKDIVSFEKINKSTRESLVNILCTTESSGSFSPISGSGIIINEKGVILTNAHIAQYFLLRDYIKKDFVTCSIRMGSPSYPLYKAEPLYISEEWIINNYQNITQQNYSENGESDYAFLLITETTNNENELPNKFPRVDYDVEENTLEVGSNVLLGGYPAGFLGGITIQKDLNIATTIGQIKKLYTFSERTLDFISLGGSVLAQKGSSGGAVMNNQNKLIGLIVTTTDSKLTQERDLGAITLAHINRNLQKEIGLDIKTFLSFNLVETSKSFNKVKAPVLKKLLITALEK